MTVGFALCVAGYAVRLLVHIRSHKTEAAQVPRGPTMVLVFLGYFGWGYWSGADPVKMNIPYTISIPVGGLLTVLGLALFLFAELKRHGVADSEELVTTGIYSKLRHPMYVGLVLMHLGFPFVFRSFVAFVSTALWLSFILSWRRYEEKNLERRFGQRYLDYKKQTWF